MKITVLSGGSGNDRLIVGLKNIYKNCDVKVITNMYDSGKSTGICRKVTDTLGVSDVRKNHSRMYKALNENPNHKILEFYDGRFDFTKNKEKQEIISLLEKWDMSEFSCYVSRFFSRNSASLYDYKDFNVANIVYSEMYAEEGYECTNKFFCDYLGIDDFVIINSFDNVYLKARTEKGYIIEDEGDLVNYKNSEDKILEIFYEGNIRDGNNIKAESRILESDLIIISTGTFWSSIYPTLHFENFYKYINKSKAKKIWAINNEEDKDAFGVSSNDFIDIFSRLGLNLNDFTILENLDSIDSLHERNDNYNIVYKSMGNYNGKHDADIFAREILNIYYNLNETYDKIIFDFDDTLWSRDYKSNKEHLEVSIDNIKKLTKISISEIVSANTYYSLFNKISNVYGTDLDGFNVPFWADSNCRRFIGTKCTKVLDNLKIDNSFYLKLKSILEKEFYLSPSIDNNDIIFNIKIKPLNNLERKLLLTILNSIYLLDTDYVAISAGSTTVDIIHKNNSKVEVYKALGLDNKKVLYVGDEVDYGNDKKIAENCTNSICVSNIEETNALLTLIGDRYGKS